MKVPAPTRPPVIASQFANWRGNPPLRSTGAAAPLASPGGEAAPVRTLGLKRNAGDQPICGSSIRPAERSPIPKPKHCTCRKLTARIPLPTRLRRATFPPGEGIAPCGRPAPQGANMCYFLSEIWKCPDTLTGRVAFLQRALGVKWIELGQWIPSAPPAGWVP